MMIYLDIYMQYLLHATLMWMSNGTNFTALNCPLAESYSLTQNAVKPLHMK
jgi:hypothetical protein